MSQSLAALVYQDIESSIHPTVVMSNAVADAHSVWLQLANNSFSIWEQPFLELSSNSSTVAAIESDVPSKEVVAALDKQLNGGVSAIQTLLETRHYVFDATPWEITILARAKVAGRHVLVGTGFEKISKSDYWLAIAETSDPNDLRAYKLLTEPIHQALNDSKPVMLAALTHSPQALAAIIELDKALQILPEKRELLEAAGPGTPARMPTRL